MLDELFGGGSRGSSPSRSRETPKPRLETLEDRAVPAVVIGGSVYHDLNNNGIRDISERKAAEAALSRKTEELEIAARIDRIGARVMVAMNQQEGDDSPAAKVLRVLADEAGYRPLALYEYDEWQAGLALGAGLGLPPSQQAAR